MLKPPITCRPFPHINAPRGFTMVELMVTVAILAILLSIAAPGMKQMIDGQRASSSANEILSGLSLARAEAIRRNTRMRFCLGTNSKLWELRAGDDATVLRQGDVNANAELTPKNVNTSAVANHGCVDYRSDGLPYNGTTLVTDGEFKIIVGSSTRFIHIKTGSIYVDKT